VHLLCRVVQMSRAGYYARKRRAAEQPQPKKGELALRVQVRAEFRRSRGTYCNPRVHRELRENGIRTSRKRVERLMREDGLCARP
jgi:transposase InsO family protein